MFESTNELYVLGEWLARIGLFGVSALVWLLARRLRRLDDRVTEFNKLRHSVEFLLEANTVNGDRFSKLEEDCKKISNLSSRIESIESRFRKSSNSNTKVAEKKPAIQYITQKEAARLLKVGAKLISKLIDSGKLTAFKRGYNWCLKKEDVLKHKSLTKTIIRRPSRS